MIKRNKNKINYDEGSIFDQIQIDNLTDEELAKTDFIFLECLTKTTDEDQTAYATWQVENKLGPYMHNVFGT